MPCEDCEDEFYPINLDTEARRLIQEFENWWVNMMLDLTVAKMRGWDAPQAR